MHLAFFMEVLANFHILSQQVACQCMETVHDTVFKYFSGQFRKKSQKKSF